jgi:serine/threonine protein kinase
MPSSVSAIPWAVVYHLSHNPSGHQDAYELCSILHRDVSGKNIMMTPDGLGILNDWDLAKKVVVHPQVETPRRHERTVGTFTYIIVLLSSLLLSTGYLAIYINAALEEAREASCRPR